MLSQRKRHFMAEPITNLSDGAQEPAPNSPRPGPQTAAAESAPKSTAVKKRAQARRRAKREQEGVEERSGGSGTPTAERVWFGRSVAITAAFATVIVLVYILSPWLRSGLDQVVSLLSDMDAASIRDWILSKFDFTFNTASSIAAIARLSGKFTVFEMAPEIHGWTAAIILTCPICAIDR
jgi:hypothetical protein